MGKRVVVLLFLFGCTQTSDHESMMNPANTEKQPYTNRLIHEKSPYLLQHAHNPVDWYPWGKAALEKAKREDKPVFLSIGYSTCHWCHVMEEESFENPQIAKIMNEHFVSIKVDREERPDLDQIYMQAVMAMTGSGGWPMSVFLTPEGKPFYGGTYFPPEDRWGRPGFKTTLLSVSSSWRNNREELSKTSQDLLNLFRQQESKSSSPRGEATGQNQSLTVEVLQSAYQQLRSAYDPHYGGFGQAPKFPRSHVLSLLLRYWKRSNDPQALAMVEKTLQEMVKGGMYDHLGGGFHRYSTDERWFVPHFEKMLYDQALIVRTYLEAYQVTHNALYAKVAREVLDYVLRDMTSPEGGFYSAEDADSAPDPNNPNEKREGAFYVWSHDEMVRVLSEETAQIFASVYGVEKTGNVTQDPQGEFNGENILYERVPLDTAAQQFQKEPQELERIASDAKRKLFQERSRRLRPHLDDKILVDWNGLMIASFAFAARVLEEPKYLEAAQKAAEFILTQMRRADGRLLHRYREKESAIPAYLEDYAFLIHGLIGLYEAGFNPKYLVESLQLTQQMQTLFWDEANGGFYLAGNDAEELVLRPKEIYDGAIPSGNSVAALNLIRLARFTLDKELEKRAEQIFSAFSREVSRNPEAYPQFLIALDFALGPSSEIVIAGDPQDSRTQSITQQINQHFLPNIVVILHPSTQINPVIEEKIPYVKELKPIQGQPTVYVCQNFACQLPVTSFEELEKQLK